MTLMEEMKELLKEDSWFVDSEGNLLKNMIVEEALNRPLDGSLIKLLLKNDRIKQHFFKDIDGVLVFDKEKFTKFIDNKEFLPDSYTAFKNKIGLANEEGKYLAKSNEVVLVWPYKDCVLEGGQEEPDEKRKEIFHNVILAPDEIDRLLEPKVFTNFKRIDKDGEHPLEEFRRDPEINKKRGLPENTITDNLIIKGNNLLVLHSLLKEFRGKVKLIYIDPPYNTGNDEFQYNDNFKHSTWLTFMKNRLEVAKELLKDDGVILVQIDDKEEAYLKVLMDEIFSRDNFINTISVRSSTSSGLKTAHRDKTIIKTKDYILIYKKNEIVVNPQYKKRKRWDPHYSKYFIKKENKIINLKDILIEKGFLSPNDKLSDLDLEDPDFIKFYKENKDKIFQTQPVMPKKYKEMSIKNRDTIIKYIDSEGNENYALNGRRFVFLSDSFGVLEDGSEDLALLICDFWDDIDFQNTQNEGGISFPSGKKPEKLIARVLRLFTKERDIVLDFFVGSGTTCAVAHKMGRQYIGVEQLDYGENSAVVRLKNVINGDQTGISKAVGWQGGGDFVYMELMKLNEAFVEKIQDAETSEELLSIWEEMKHNGFLSYRVDPRLFDENIEGFKALSLEEQKKLLLEMLDYNDLYVNYSEIDDAIYNVSEEDKKLNKEFYEGKKDA